MHQKQPPAKMAVSVIEDFDTESAAKAGPDTVNNIIFIKNSACWPNALVSLIPGSHR